MKSYLSIIGLIVVLGWVSIAAADTVHKSTLSDQTAVEVTVYNSNLGLIKDTRQVDVPKGRGELLFMDVASHIRPVTVHVQSVDNPQGFTVLEQNYEYDLISSKKILDKYVGKKIKIIDWNRYQDRRDVVDAVLLSNNKGQVFKIKDEIYLGHPGVRVLPQLPQNLIAKPTLTWLYDNERSRPQRLVVSYLTNNINWKADYVVLVNKDDTSADISGWVTIINKSGATYRDARLKLVAGEIHRAKEEVELKEYTMAPRARRKSSSFKEKAFFEYHIYDLDRKTTIKERQTKQLSLLEADRANITKEFVLYGIKSYFTRLYRPMKPKQPVSVFIKFNNSKENHLGMPLPAGVMRLYKQDGDGSRQFIGEDKIEHTPKDEEVRLKIGRAFDVVAERRQTDYKALTRSLHESEWEIKIRNHKQNDVIVRVIEPLFGNWKVIAKSHPYKKTDAHTIEFDVKVPKDGEAKIKYRVQVGL